MPSKSPEQAKLMRAVAHNRGFAKKVKIPQSVGQDYVKADKRKFGSGRSTKAQINRQDTRKGKLDLPFAKLNKYAGMAEGGDVKVSKSKKFASGGKTPARKMSSEEFLKDYEKSPLSGRMKQEAYWAANPEPGLEKVYPEKLLIPGGSSKAASAVSKILPHQKPGSYRSSDAKKKTREMRERIKEADAKKEKVLPSSGPYIKRNVGTRPQSDEFGTKDRLADNLPFRKGGSIKSPVSRRADGVSQRGKTRGKFV